VLVYRCWWVPRPRNIHHELARELGQLLSKGIPRFLCDDLLQILRSQTLCRFLHRPKLAAWLEAEQHVEAICRIEAMH
jgi:hypothetical protein